jgi:adenosylhomocysteine nucleosidase
MPEVAIIAALEREVSAFTKGWSRVQQDHEGRSFVFFERDEMVVVCGGIGLEAARRAAEAVTALYRPKLLLSAGFAGALIATLHVGDLVTPGVVIDARDGSRVELHTLGNTLVSFMAVAGVEQKAVLAQAYSAQAVDMEAAAVAAAARAHGLPFGAFKVISDESNFEMPQMARFIDAQGHFQTASFALFAFLRPWLWPRVARLARNSKKAAASLAQWLQTFNYMLNRSSQRAAPAAAYPEPHAAATIPLKAGDRE